MTTKLDIYRHSHYTAPSRNNNFSQFHPPPLRVLPKAINFYARLLPCTEVREEWLEQAAALCSFARGKKRNSYNPSFFFQRDVKISRWEEHFGEFFMPTKTFFSYFSHFHLHHRRHSSAKSWEGGRFEEEREREKLNSKPVGTSNSTRKWQVIPASIQCGNQKLRNISFTHNTPPESRDIRELWVVGMKNECVGDLLKW